MINTIIDSKYEVLEQIGQGGFGQVYKVRNVADGQLYALKVCVSTDAEELSRFRREMRLMAGINSPYVVKLLDCNLDGAHPWFVMPLAKASLVTYLPKLKSNHPFTLKLFLRICEGVKAIHSASQFHRDIKPANVLIMDDDSVVVSDLGLGTFEKRDSTILTSSNVYMGTEGYIPPEYRIAGGTKNADARGDVFQLGKMLYEMLTGEDPILIDMHALPSPLMYIIQRATKEHARERFQSVAELMDAVNNYIASLDVNAHPIKAFESYIEAAKELARQGQYDKILIGQIIMAIRAIESDSEMFFELIDKLPADVVKKIVVDFEGDFNYLFYIYNSAIMEYVGNNSLGFEYAEKIANLMRVIFNASKDLGIRKVALKINLVTAIYYNRYYAMGVFDDLLLSVKNDQEASLIAIMLIEEADSFENRIDVLPYKDLHPKIRDVVDYIKSKNKTESKPFSFDDL
jgi:serine/threonine protein kinase